MGLSNISSGDLLLYSAAVAGIIACIFTVRAFYKKNRRPNQTALGKNIYQAGGDIKIGRGKND